MALKTYVATIARVKKFEVSDYLRYLLSDDHNNHVGRTEILSNSQDPKKFFARNAAKVRGSIRRRIERRQKKSRGWHNPPASDSNKSLVFTVPVSYEPTVEQLEQLQAEAMKFLIEDYREKGFEVGEEDFFSNIHRQRNNHINFIIPGIDANNGFKVIKHIRNDHYRYHMATKWTAIVDKVLNKNFDNYDKNAETLAVIERETDKMEDDFYSLEDLARLKEEKGLNKLLKRLYAYYYRVAKKAEEDATLMARIEKTLVKIEAGDEVSKEDKQFARDIFNGLELKMQNERLKKELKRGTTAKR